MNTPIINKTMDRCDLLTNEAKPIIQSINEIIAELYSKKLYMTSWIGSLPTKIELNTSLIKNLVKTILGLSESREGVGVASRGPNYVPLPNSVDDAKIPWYLYWEIFWVLKNGPQVKSEMRLLDAGGASSLFSCYLASLGADVHSIDISKTLVSNGKKIAAVMGWKMFSYAMNMTELEFEDEYFDHAYSICVFEHLDYQARKSALSEIARCLKPNGILSITFDYRNPAPFIAGYGPDTSKGNRISTKEDVQYNFLSTKHFELLGNQEFFDNGKSYLVNPKFDNTPYTFGAVFLKKKS